MSENKTCPRICGNCKHGKTAETSHEWIETHCSIYNKWHSPWDDACERFEEDTDDDTEIET